MTTSGTNQLYYQDSKFLVQMYFGQVDINILQVNKKMWKLARSYCLLVYHTLNFFWCDKSIYVSTDKYLINWLFNWFIDFTWSKAIYSNTVLRPDRKHISSLWKRHHMHCRRKSRHSLSRKGPLSCHACCNKGPRFLQSPSIERLKHSAQTSHL